MVVLKAETFSKFAAAGCVSFLMRSLSQKLLDLDAHVEAVTDLTLITRAIFVVASRKLVNTKSQTKQHLKLSLHVPCCHMRVHMSARQNQIERQNNSHSLISLSVHKCIYNYLCQSGRPTTRVNDACC